MRNISRAMLFLLSCAIATGHAFQTSQTLPMRMDPIPKQEIRQRLGLKEVDSSSGGSVMSVGSGPNMGYSLMNEHEVVCPVTEAHQGILCTAGLSVPIDGEYDAESIFNNHGLVSQAIMSGSLAASVRNECADGNSMYYLPIVVTLVESLMADEMESIDWSKMVFNRDGLETNEIMMDFTTDENVVLYACNTHADRVSAVSDVYIIPKEKKGKVWKLSVEYKVATINLQQIVSFGDRDSSTPLRPDVWLKDDYY